MRRVAKRDRNEREIIDALENAGASVQQLNEAGVPDLLVSTGARNTFLMEVKGVAGPRGGTSRRTLTDDQVRWRQLWIGAVFTVRTPEEALDVIGAMS